MFRLFVYINFRLWSHWICSLLLLMLLPRRWAGPMSSRGDSAAVGFLALSYFDSFLADVWLLEVSAVLRNVIRIKICFIIVISTSTRSVCKSCGVGVIEIPLFDFTLVTNHDIWILSVGSLVGILPSMENRNAHRIDSFVVISRPFYHSLRQGGYRIRIGMIVWFVDVITVSLINRLLDPRIHFDVCISALRLFLAVLIVFHVHILLYFAQVLLRLGNHRFQLWRSEPWSILDIRKFQNIGLTAIGILIASLQRVVDAIANGLVGFSVVLLWIVLPDRIGWADHGCCCFSVSLHVCLSIEAG